MQVVNFELTKQSIDLSIQGIVERNFGLGSGVVVYTITGEHPEDENSFENPKNVGSLRPIIYVDSSSFIHIVITIWEVSFLIIRESPSSGVRDLE